MKRPLTEEDLRERASIDGRVAFAAVAFAGGAGLVALLDRIGVPERIAAVLVPVLAMAGLALAGLLVHSVKVSRFYAAGRSTPAPYGGLAMLALTIGLILPFLPPGSAGAPLRGLAPGLAAGFAIAALVTGPLLRKTGAFSLPDMIAARFPNLGVRLGAAAIVSLVSLAIATAGFEGAVRILESSVGASRGMAVFLTGGVILLIILPGGVCGVVWGAAGAAGIFLAAISLPLALMALGGEALPAPVLLDTAAWKSAWNLIGVWQGGGGRSSFVMMLALALGLGSLAPLLAPAATTGDTATARKAGLSSLAWSATALAVIGVSIAVAAIAAEQWMTGERADRLPAFAYKASAAGLLKICGAFAGTAEAALAACRDATGFAGLVLRPQDYTPEGLWLVLGMPEMREFGVALSGLVSAGFIAIALMLAAAGFQSFATSLGHDALYRVRDINALASRRLAMTRIIMMIGVMTTGLVLSRMAIDPRTLIGLAILLSAAAIAPLLALALWPRASGTDAALALLGGLAAFAAVIAAGPDFSNAQNLALAAMVSCATAFITGVATSFRHSGGLASEGSHFLHSVLHGESDVLHRDRSA